MLWGLFYAVISHKRCFLVKNTLVYDEGILIASPRRPPFFGQSGGGLTSRHRRGRLKPRAEL